MPTNFWIAAYAVVAVATALYSHYRYTPDHPSLRDTVETLRAKGVSEAGIRRGLAVGDGFAGLFWWISIPQDIYDTIRRRRKAKKEAAAEQAAATAAATAPATAPAQEV
jgi:hypothetical protein